MFLPFKDDGLHLEARAIIPEDTISLSTVLLQFCSCSHALLTWTISIQITGYPMTVLVSSECPFYLVRSKHNIL